MEEMKFAVVASEKDEAGKNIFKHIHENFPMLNHYLIREDTIYAENIDKTLLKNYDFIIFASKHASEKKVKAFSIHAPGNWHKAELGGKNETVCKTSALFMKHIFQILNKNNYLRDYHTTLECTHHGPYIEKPCLFIEIGSSEKEWKDAKAGEIIAKTIAEAIKTQEKIKKQDWSPCLIIGGGHYNQAANKIMLRTNYAVGHICPKYMLEYLDENLINEAINKTIPKPEIILLDWKGLGQYKQKVKDLLEKMGLKYQRI